MERLAGALSLFVRRRTPSEKWKSESGQSTTHQPLPRAPGCKAETPMVIRQIRVLHSDEMELAQRRESRQRTGTRSADAASETSTALRYSRARQHKNRGNQSDPSGVR